METKAEGRFYRVIPKPLSYETCADYRTERRGTRSFLGGDVRFLAAEAERHTISTHSQLRTLFFFSHASPNPRLKIKKIGKWWISNSLSTIFHFFLSGNSKIFLKKKDCFDHMACVQHFTAILTDFYAIFRNLIVKTLAASKA